MGFFELLFPWVNLAPGANVILVTDSGRKNLALEIQSDLQRCSIINIDETNSYYEDLLTLQPSDLVAVLFGFDTFVFKGANKVFSPFDKPEGLKAKYVFFRLGISAESLRQGLSTPKELIYSTIDLLHNIAPGSRLRVTNAAGTDISLLIDGFSTCSHCIEADGDMAFLPPSETSAEVISNTASGKIVVDVTVGQLYYKWKFLGYFGLVDSPVTLTLDNGVIVDITGGQTALELKEKLFALEPECRVLVELGHGLSQMAPTGLIGVDESIIDTCHFGIGDSATCGVHLDVVVSHPNISRIEDL